MQYTHHQMTIELPMEGIVSIDSLHLSQKINCHTSLSLEARMEEEAALRLVEESETLPIALSLPGEGRQERIFCGRSREVRLVRKEGLLVLCATFSGGTYEWDRVKKSRSFPRLAMPYGQVLTQVLSGYRQAQIRDEASKGASIGQFLLQYEETDWAFLQRLASHFGTMLFAEDSAPYGKVYFGFPARDRGKVLRQEAYTLVRRSQAGEGVWADILPQEFYRWQVESEEFLQLGEGVSLSHIPVVVTGVERKTDRGRIRYTYELSRRKGILCPRRYQEEIAGMSLPGTIRERKGNRVRLQLDVDQGYVSGEDVAWFTYGIETSNLYCMPEEGSRVHLYFPDREEGNAIAVHALRMEGGGSAKPRQSGGGVSSGNSGNSGNSGSHGGSAPFVGAATALAGAALSGKEKASEEEQQQEKDPRHKIFSDPGGSFLALTPEGVTLAAGGGASLGMTSAGTLTLRGESLCMESGNAFLIGTGKKGKLPRMYLEAREAFTLSLTGKESQICLQENTRLLSAFIKKEASLKRLAQPAAARIRTQVTEGDAGLRSDINSQTLAGLTDAALVQKEELLAQKEARAQAQIQEGIFSILTVVASAAIVVATGGAAAPLVAAMAVTGGFKTVSAIADISEGFSDLGKVEAGDISPSYNFMRDGMFGGNETLYQGVKGLNDIVFGMVTGKAIAGNLTRISQMQDATGMMRRIQQGYQYLKDHRQIKTALNITSELGMGAIEEYVATGTVNPVNVVVNAGTGALKGWGMQGVTIPCGSSMNRYARKITNVVTNTAVGVGVDWIRSGLTGEPFDISSSVQQNLMVAGVGEMMAEPIDAATGSFLLSATDLRLPGIGQELALSRSYSSIRRRAGWFGRGWQCCLESRLYRDGELLHVFLPCGYVCAFVEEEEGYRDTLGSGRFVLTYEAIGEAWQVDDRHTHRQYRYDQKGRLIQVREKTGERTTFTYALLPGEEELTITTSLGYRLALTFRKGKVCRVKDHTGRSLCYGYEGDFLTTVTHPEGGRTRYCYDAQGYLCAPVDQTGLTYLTNTYDEKGRVTLQRLANGETYTLTYRDRKRQIEMAYSAFTGATTYTCNKDQTIRQIRHSDGTVTRYEYDPYGNRTLREDRLGRKTRWDYDHLGRLVREEHPGGLIRKYVYDGRGDLVQASDNAGRSRALAYDGRHQMIRQTDRIGEAEEVSRSYVYDEKGRLIRETDGEGHPTVYTYEAHSAYPHTTTYGDGSLLTCTYSDTGRKLSEEDGAVSYTYGYNSGGYPTLVRDGEGREAHYHYDAMGRLVSSFTPRQVKEGKKSRTLYRYDFLERLIETQYPDGSREVLVRDGEGNLLKRIHPNAWDPKAGDGEGTSYRYGPDHRLIAIHHPEGGIERFFYDPQGNRTRHILPQQYDRAADDGPGYGYAYDEEDRLREVTGPEGEILARYAYDLCGNCIRYEDAQGGLHYYRYDLLGQLLERLDQTEAGDVPCFRRTAYTYDHNGNCTKEIRCGGTYDETGGLMQAGKDLTLSFAYDARSRLVRIEDSTGAGITYTYDARGNRTGEEKVILAGKEGADAPAGLIQKILYTYDKGGRCILKKELLDPGIPGEGKEWAETAYGYDDNGNRTWIRTPEGYEICRSFDARDRLEREVLADTEHGIRLTTHLAYDKAGNLVRLLQEGKEGKRELSCTYDFKDRLTRLAELDGPVVSYGYDGNDHRTQERRLLPGEGNHYLETTYGYDPRGNLLHSKRGGEVLEACAYDTAGNRIGRQDGDGVGLRIAYGMDGQVQTVTTGHAFRAGQVSRRLSYDARGRITGIQEAGGKTTGFRLDGWGRVERVSHPEGGEEGYTYDAAGNILSATDARGGVVSYAYTSRSQVASITDALGHREYFYYDKEGRQTRHADRKGTVTETRYNVYGKPTFQVCTDRKGRRQVMGQWSYDDFGNVREAKAGGFHYTCRYRPDGKLLEKESQGKRVLTCTYYPEGSLKSMTDERGHTLAYTYDSEGRLEALTTEEGKVLARYGYTKAGRLSHIQSGNGIHTAYSYDEDGNLKGLTIQKEGGGVVYDAAYTYDLRGNRLSKAGTGIRSGIKKASPVQEGEEGPLLPFATHYTYDLMDRLVGEERERGGEEYVYDRNGNRVEKRSYRYVFTEKAERGGDREALVDYVETCCYNRSNQLTQRKDGTETTVYTYDENGSLIRETSRIEARGKARGGKGKERTTRYHYDLLNRQEKVTLPEGRAITHHYDGEGLRAGMTIGEEETYTFLYHQGQLLREERNGDFLRGYAYGHGLAALEGADSQYHSAHLDEQGSTLYLTNQTAGIDNAYSYDAFGNLLAQAEGIPGETINSRILYTGQIYDKETGQYYLRARFYHPTMGRFQQEDSYRGDGLNLYAYCANNPVVYFDPSGRSANVCKQDGTAKTDEQPVQRVEGGSGSIIYGELDSLGRTTGIEAIITPDMIGTGSPAKPSIKPAGFGGQAQGHARGHLLGNQLGGSGSNPRNLVTIYQNPVNHPVMSSIEGSVRKAVEGGQIVNYKVTPIYQGNNLISSGITIQAQGSGDLNIYQTILNRK